MNESSNSNSVPKTAVRPASTDGSLISAPSPTTVQKEAGRSTPSLRSNYLRSSSAVSMESSNTRSHNSSPSLEGNNNNGLNALFDNSNSDNDADYTPVMKKR